MCGIAGYVGPEQLPDARLEACLGLMRNRGPDHGDVYHHSPRDGHHVQLLHTRLSIIDLDPRANQPIRLGKRVMTANAELYNYIEVRETLTRRGHEFRTESDVEVLLQALAADGTAALDYCEGMWAFALYDEDSGTLALSRDRFGEKPLYTLRDETGFYFGSEVKFLAALRGARIPVNWDQLYRYLTYGYKSLYKGAATFFQGVAEVPAASTLSMDAAAETRTERYWDPLPIEETEMSFAEAADSVRELLSESVRLRLRADVPLAFCMSGGVDSNALISIAKNVFDHDVHGFTIVNTDERYDEWDLVTLAVKSQKLRHTAIPVSSDGFLDRLAALVRYHDAPVATITYFAHSLLIEAIADHGYKIAISGTAADELFSGYFDHHGFYLAELERRHPEMLPQALANWHAHVGPVVRNPILADPHILINNPNERSHIYYGWKEFATYLRAPAADTDPFEEESYTHGVLRNRMLNEMFHEAVPVILHEDDLNSMRCSVENRSPFLDRRLFEFCQTIPTRHLVREGRAKAVLREALRGIAPDAILDNPRKVGFNAPVFDYLGTDDPVARSRLLDDGPIFEHVRRDKIAAMLSRDDLPNSESKFLFYFLSAKLFLEEVA